MPAQAIRQLAACQLSGHLNGSTVIVETDVTNLQLLEKTCFGRSVTADRSCQNVEGTTEQVKIPEDPSDDLSEAARYKGEANELTNSGSSQGVHTAAAASPVERGLPAASIKHVEVWGATYQIGQLGALSIDLPAAHAARVESQPGVSFSRSPAENLREPGSAEQAKHEEAREQAQKTKSRRYANDNRNISDLETIGISSAPIRLYLQIVCRKGKHAKRSRTGQEEVAEGRKVWMLSLEEAFFLQFALQALTVSASAGALTSQVLCCHAQGMHMHSVILNLPP